MKVLYMTNLPVPYRMAFFEELGKKVDLTVAFERKSATNREQSWLVDHADGFKAIFLKGKPVGEEDGFCPEICKVIRKGKYDLVIVGVYHTPTAMLAIEYMRLHKIPYMISSDGGFVKDDVRLKHKIKAHYMTGANGYFSPSACSDDYIVHYGADPKKICRYPFTSMRETDIPQYEDVDRSYYRKKIGITEPEMILGIGQFIHRKGWDILIQAVAQIDRNIAVVIVGGEAPSDYKKLCDDHGLKHIYFENFKDKKTLANYYRAADITILPTREDIWGLVVNESLSYGVPVITTDRCNAGMELIEEGKTGSIVPVDQVIELRDAIVKAFNKPYDRKACVDRMKSFTIEKMAEIYYQYMCKEITSK